MITSAYVFLLCQLVSINLLAEHAACAAPPQVVAARTINHLDNPLFELTAEGKLTGWNVTQHAGEAAYRVTVSDNELHIEKHGEQYYMMVSQFVNLQGLRTKSLRFSAEMKQNMHANNWYQSLEPGGGLLVNIVGTKTAAFGPVLGSHTSVIEHEPKLGVFDWTPISICFEVSEHAKTLKVAFIHQAYGDMSIRQPSLVIDEEGCAAETTTDS